ncbi:MAG: hypothetical protein V2I27_13070 [Erythrobacter sp.]|jgi:hypothetical protein|nr:hypothetical protein [Erythrobacter sp.]
MATHDLDKSKRLYSGFISTLKWVVPTIAVIVLIVIALIAG